MSLAVRHRPRRLADVAGQRTAVDVLAALTSRRPVPQQILLAGPSGVGKTTLARIFAAALFCPTPVDGDACGVCETCMQVTGPGGQHPDVIEIDAASYGGVDKIRELGERAHLAPARASWRIYIIDEAHGLTRDGGQAFLRLLEEPAEHTIFILATTDPQKLPLALRGRCVSCYVTAPDRDDLVANLARVADAEGWPVGRDILSLVVDATDPDLGVRGTVVSLEKVASAAADGTLTAARAAHLLGVADPEAFARLTTGIVTRDRRAALVALTQVTDASAAPLVRAQLLRWADTQLRSRVRDGGDVDEAVWWADQLTAADQLPLAVTVARMCDPAVAGVEGLSQLITRAEAVADRISATLPSGSLPTLPSGPLPTPAPAARPDPAPVTPPAGRRPTTAPPSPVATPAPPTATPAPEAAPVAAPVAAPAPAGMAPETPSASAAAPVVPVVPEPVRSGDPGLVALLNELATQGSGRAALWLRSTAVTRAGTQWLIAGDPNGHATALESAAGRLGWTVTFTG